MELEACLRFLPVSGGPPLAVTGTDRHIHRPGEPEPAALVRLPGCELELMLCGVGPVAAALNLGRRLGRERAPRGIVNFGIAGSYDIAAAPPGALVLASEEVFPEFGVWPHRGESGDPVPLPLSFPQAEIFDKKVFTRLTLEPDRALGNMGLNWHSDLPRGTSVSVAGVSGTPQRARHMAALSGGLTENMEGFSLALGAAAAGIPFAELRAVSNEAGLRPPQGWDMPAALDALGRGTRDLLAPFFLPAQKPRPLHHKKQRGYLSCRNSSTASARNSRTSTR